MNNFAIKQTELTAIINDWLSGITYTFNGDVTLDEACRYAVNSPGKRIRPVLSLLVGELFNVPVSQIKPFALAIELIHTASLVHDDLPALDNDLLRRGIPTVHKKFGEAVALLCGDALISKAFMILSGPDTPVSALPSLVKLLADATYRMCHGQVLDMNPAPGEGIKELECRHRNKTGAIIEASGMGAAYLAQANATDEQLEGVRSYTRELGLLFQITDDILDAPGVERGREDQIPTYVSVLGLDGARKEAERVAANAEGALGIFGGRAAGLVEFVGRVLNREG